VPSPISSGSRSFDVLRGAFLADVNLRTETEWAFRLAVETYNPSDRGIRFIIGGIGEWIITLAAYKAGLITMPGGHNADGHDTESLLREQGKNLWSVKTSYDPKASYKFTITNGQGGAGKGLVVPTVFLAPGLPGIVMVDPKTYPEMAAFVEAKEGAGETKLAKVHVLAFAENHPECVIPFTMPPNPGAAIREPSLEAVRLLVDVDQFPTLRKMFADVRQHDTGKSLVDQIQRLKHLKDTGALTDDAYEAAIKKIVSA
jgi:hypothetical protein